MPTERVIYRSANGDRWLLIGGPNLAMAMVRHEPNQASGGRATEMTVGEFLSVDGPGPEFAALRRLVDRQLEK
jgi:hypothetical protein